MNCIHCGIVESAKRHDGFCPYNPTNLKKIAEYMNGYVERESRFNKQLKPFPSSKELDSWFRLNRVLSVKTIRKHYFDGSMMKIEDWLSQLISYGLDNGILNEEDFPIYILYIWDSWLFHSLEEYQELYKVAISYEEGNYSKGVSLDFEVKPFSLEKEGVF